jgi:4-amino-4-deoxy-L-arabinose transferase-like glycosyltransferase
LYARAIRGVDHGEPAYYYLWVGPVVVLPWLVLVASALRASWRRWLENRDERDLWLLCWLFAPLAILSLVKDKLPVYLLPVMPPIAVLVGRFSSEHLANRVWPTRLQIRMESLFVVAALIGALVATIGYAMAQGSEANGSNRIADALRVPQKAEVARLILQSRTLWLSGSILSIIALIGWWGSRRGGLGGPRWVFGAFASVTPCIQLFLIVEIMPALDAAYSWREVAAAANAVTKSGEPLVFYGLRPFAAYYLDDAATWFRKQNSLRDFVHRHGKVWCATQEEELVEIERHCLIDRHPGHSFPSPSGPVILIQLRPLTMATN